MPDLQEKTGEQEQAAAAQNQGENAEDASQQKSGETETQATAEEQIAAFKAKAVDETKKRQDAEAQVAGLTAQFNVLNQQQAAQQQPKQQVARSYFREKFNLEPDEQPTAEMIESFAAQVQQQNVAWNQQQNVQAANQRFINSKTDYAEKVGVVGVGGFTPSATLQKAMAQDPELMQGYADGSLTPNAAYKAVKAFETATELAAMKATALEQKNLKDAALKTNPLSPAAAGGGGSVNTGINAGADPNTQEGRDTILANFQKMQEGDFDEDTD